MDDVIATLVPLIGLCSRWKQGHTVGIPLLQHESYSKSKWTLAAKACPSRDADRSFVTQKMSLRPPSLLRRPERISGISFSSEVQNLRFPVKLPPLIGVASKPCSFRCTLTNSAIEDQIDTAILLRRQGERSWERGVQVHLASRSSDWRQPARQRWVSD